MDYTVTTSKSGAGKGNSYGVATVDVTDNCGNPVEGAFVSGHFTGDFSDAFTNVATDAEGKVTFITSTYSKRPKFGFEVDGLTHGTLTY